MPKSLKIWWDSDLMASTSWSHEEVTDFFGGGVGGCRGVGEEIGCYMLIYQGGKIFQLCNE